MRLERVRPEALLLPGRVIGILDGEIGQAGVGIEIKGLKLLQKHIHRPAVSDDVVQDDGQEVIVFAQLPGGETDQRPAGQVEGRPGQISGLSQCVVQPNRVAGFQADMQLGQDALAGLAVTIFEDGAQAGVAGDDAIERGFQTNAIQQPAQAHRGGDVIDGGIGIELMEKPEALLGWGK